MVKIKRGFVAHVTKATRLQIIGDMDARIGITPNEICFPVSGLLNIR